jgi:ABC-type sugar transport system substrate-binding protein
MKAIWIQTDQPAIGALRAIKAARKDGQILVAAFDGIPEFVDLLKSGQIVATGMQQPYLMGEKSAEALFDHLNGKTPEKEILVPILGVTSENIDQLLPTIKETVFANEMK